MRFILLGDVDSNPNSVSPSEVEGWVVNGILEWPGQVADVVPYITQSSVYVLPSYYREGIPRSTQKAMAMGRPVITTDNTGCRETRSLRRIRGPGSVVPTSAFVAFILESFWPAPGPP